MLTWHTDMVLWAHLQSSHKQTLKNLRNKCCSCCFHNAAFKFVRKSQKMFLKRIKNGVHHGINWWPTRWPKESEASQPFTNQSYACVAFFFSVVKQRAVFALAPEIVFYFLLSLFCKCWFGSCDTSCGHAHFMCRYGTLLSEHLLTRLRRRSINKS